jgi:hypothetical protein
MGAAGAEGDFELWFDSFRYCPECVEEAVLFSADAADTVSAHP